MPAEANCPHCRLTLRVPQNYHGRSVKCPQCQQRFIVTLPGMTGVRPIKKQPGFDDLVMSALDEDEANEPEVGHVAAVDRPSEYWRCPQCSVIARKKQLANTSLPNVRIKAMVRCDDCGAAFDFAAMQAGKYDVKEVTVTCSRCHVDFTGPAEDLLGQPCPACGLKLPSR